MPNMHTKKDTHSGAWIFTPPKIHEDVSKLEKDNQHLKTIVGALLALQSPETKALLQEQLGDICLIK